MREVDHHHLRTAGERILQDFDVQLPSALRISPPFNDIGTNTSSHLSERLIVRGMNNHIITGVERNIHEVESALGDGFKRRSEAEKDMYKKARRSVIAQSKIPKGTSVTKDMLTVKRPGFGIKPKYIDHIVGRKAKVDIEEDEILTWDHFE